MKVNNDAYLTVDKSLVDPNELYDVLDSMLDALEVHLELLQSIVDNKYARRDLDYVLDEVYEMHSNYRLVGSGFPFRNRFKENWWNLKFSKH